MYQDFKVSWTENKITSTNKPYKKTTIVDGEGKETTVNIFSDFPDFANIAPGSSIWGKLEQKGQYWNITSETQGKGKFGASGGFKGKQIEEAQNRKREDIGQFQANKEESIKLASAQRDAVLCAISQQNADMYFKDTPEPLKESIVKWRNWFLTDFTKDIPPF